MSEESQKCPACEEVIPVEYVVCPFCAFDLTEEKIRRSGIKIGRSESLDRMKRTIVSPFPVVKEISILPDRRGGSFNLMIISIALIMQLIIVIRKLDKTGYISSSGSMADTDYLSLSISWWIIHIPINFSVRFIFTIVFLLLGSFVLFCMLFLAWKMGTRMMVFVSRTLGGKAEKDNIRSILGYSLTPIAIGETVSLFFFLFLGLPNDASSAGDWSEIDAAVQSMVNSGLMSFIKFIMLLCWAWMIFLSSYGMGRANRLSPFEGFIVTIVPIGILLLMIY
ncbi:MAG: hypothetical protein ACTSYA_12275 [Candidatus Kariarchaeaceae archaeon]